MSTIRKTSFSASGMEKQNPYASTMFKSFPVKVFDENAFTQQDIADMAGISLSHSARMTRDKVESGEWEQVWKRMGTRSVRAYRPSLNK